MRLQTELGSCSTSLPFVEMTVNRTCEIKCYIPFLMKNVQLDPKKFPMKMSSKIFHWWRFPVIVVLSAVSFDTGLVWSFLKMFLVLSNRLLQFVKWRIELKKFPTIQCGEFKTCSLSFSLWGECERNQVILIRKAFYCWQVQNIQTVNKFPCVARVWGRLT